MDCSRSATRGEILGFQRHRSAGVRRDAQSTVPRLAPPRSRDVGMGTGRNRSDLALSRKQGEQALDVRRLRAAQRRLKKLEVAWNEVVELNAVRHRARKLLGTHDLRAADALHLAAALMAHEQGADRFEFVIFDRRLTAAAKREGFAVLSV